MTSHLRATRHHLPYGITQCYLPPDTSELAPSNPSQTGWYLIYLPRRDGRLQIGLSSASSVASSTLRLWHDRSFLIVASQEVWGRPAGLFQSLGGTAVRILPASADSSILAKWPNSIRRLFWLIMATLRGRKWWVLFNSWTCYQIHKK